MISETGLICPVQKYDSVPGQNRAEQVRPRLSGTDLGCYEKVPGSIPSPVNFSFSVFNIRVCCVMCSCNAVVLYV